MHYKETEYGFEYGDAKIRRLFSAGEKKWVTIEINSSKNNPIQVHVTKTGKIRVHSSEGEWKVLRPIHST